MPFPNEHAARLQDPAKFDEDSYRRTAGGTIYGTKKVPKTISIIWAKLKTANEPGDKPIPQALRFPIEQWTASAAKEWLKINKITYILFEQAEDEDEEKTCKRVEMKAFFTPSVKMESGEMKVILTEQIKDRDDEIILIEGADLANFKKNPIMLWGHRMTFGGPDDVLGHWKDIHIEGNSIVATPVFASHEKAQNVKKMVEDGHLRAVSIGFIMNEYDMNTRIVQKWEMLETSWVPVGANVNAGLFDGKSFENDLNIKLLNYDKIHPKIKQYRKLFMSEEIFKVFGIEKVGNELIDMKNLHDAIIKLVKVENQPKRDKRENPYNDVINEFVGVLQETTHVINTSIQNNENI